MTGIQHTGSTADAILAAEPTMEESGKDVLDPCRDPAWDREVDGHPGKTAFHTSAWAKVLVATYGHRPVYLRLSDGGKGTTLLPLMEVRSWLTGRRGVALPFSDECGPLTHAGFEAPQFVKALTELAQRRGWKHFEVRGGVRLHDDINGEPSFCAHSLDLLRSEQEVFDGFDSSVRRAIRKAERSGLKVRVGREFRAIEQYYRLHVQTRKKHGVPPQPFQFFKNIHRELVTPGHGFVVVAEREGEPIAASVYFQAGAHAVYKFGASDETQQEYRGSNLVMWEAIKFLMKNHATTLEFGRTSMGNAGLRRFKLSWGTKERPLSYFRQATRSGAWQAVADKSEGSHRAFFGRLPLWANRFLGALLYQHLD
jgi:hypothetical protein